MKISKQWKTACAAAGLALFAAACGKTGNLFAFTHKGGDLNTTETDPVVLIADAQAAIEKGDYATAEALYVKAVTSDPTSSSARIGVVNAVVNSLRQEGFDLLNFGTSLTNQNAPQILSGVPAMMVTQPRYSHAGTKHGNWLISPDPGLQLKVPFTSLAKLFRTIYTYFKPIGEGQTDIPLDKVPTGLWLNLAASSWGSAMLSIVDPDGDNLVNYSLFYNEDNTSAPTYEVYEGLTGTALPSSSAVPLTQSQMQTKLAAAKTAAIAAVDDGVKYLGKARDKGAVKIDDKVWNDIQTTIQKLKDLISQL